MPQQYRAINRLNPDVDRKPAIKGQRTPEKLEINLTMPGDDGLKTLRFNKFNRGADMDWSKAEHIRELNRWRTQQLRSVHLFLNRLNNRLTLFLAATSDQSGKEESTSTPTSDCGSPSSTGSSSKTSSTAARSQISGP